MNDLQEHEKEMKESFEEGLGPLFEISILSYFPSPKRQSPNTPPSQQEIDDNNYKHLCDYILNGIRELSDVITITTDEEELEKSMKELCSGHEKWMHADVIINIGYKRYGRLSVELSADEDTGKTFTQFHTNIWVLEDIEAEYVCRKEFNELFQRMVDKLHGFCGTMGLEANCRDIFKVSDVATHLGDGIYGIEKIIWKADVSPY